MWRPFPARLSLSVCSFEDFLEKRICSCECVHKSGLAFQIVAGPFQSSSFYAVSVQCKCVARGAASRLTLRSNIAQIIPKIPFVDLEFRISVPPANPTSKTVQPLFACKFFDVPRVHSCSVSSRISGTAADIHRWQREDGP